jgi:hypothetical protein
VAEVTAACCEPLAAPALSAEAAAAGFERISITPTHQVADGLHSEIITATARPRADRRRPG